MLAKENTLRSNWMQTFGFTSHVDYDMGIRSMVHGSVINPCDHPHGGEDDKNSINRPGSVTPWGKPALGYKTRSKKKAHDRKPEHDNGYIFAEDTPGSPGQNGKVYLRISAAAIKIHRQSYAHNLMRRGTGLFMLAGIIGGTGSATMLDEAQNAQYKEKNITFLRAVHKYKDSRKQFEQRSYKRLIDILRPNQLLIYLLGLMNMQTAFTSMLG